jgi:SpoVK/Ycf46/Vps4 family AAA+-type ATPase
MNVCWTSRLYSRKPEYSLNFRSVKGPELINMYVAETEKNVEDILKRYGIYTAE